LRFVPIELWIYLATIASPFKCFFATRYQLFGLPAFLLALLSALLMHQTSWVRYKKTRLCIVKSLASNKLRFAPPRAMPRWAVSENDSNDWLGHATLLLVMSIQGTAPYLEQESQN